MEQHQAFLALVLRMLVVVVRLDNTHLAPEVMAQEAQAVAVMAYLMVQRDQVVQIQAVVVAAVELQVVQAVQVLSLFDMQTPLHPQLLQQVLQLLRLQVATEFINGLAQGVSHSDGTLCTT
jgi:hypothetical protein